jgi:hypothetical protein
VSVVITYYNTRVSPGGSDTTAEQSGSPLPVSRFQGW